MKTKRISPLGLSAKGVGPKIMRPAILFLITGIIIQIFYPDIVSFPFLPETILKNLGWILVVPGVLFWICAIIQFSIGFPKGKLITTGMFAVSRNPIYASWVLFILPGLSGIFNNWIFLLAAIVMYIALVLHIKSEEENLARVFGEEYKDYSNHVDRFFNLYFPY